MAQFRNNYSEVSDLSRFPGAQWYTGQESVAAMGTPEGGVFTPGYYTLGNSEGNVTFDAVNPWRSVSYRDLKDAGLWDLRDPNGPAWQALKARGYGNIGDIGTKPEATAYAMMDLLGPTATSADWNAAFSTMDPNLVRSVVPAIRSQQIVLANDANSTTNRVENFAENAILPALASLLLGVPAAGSLFGTGATAAQAGATAGAIGGGTAGLQSGDTLADVLKGAAIGGASGGTLGTLTDLIPPSLIPDLPAATQTPQFGEMAPAAPAPVTAPQPTTLAELLQQQPAPAPIDWNAATAAAPTGTMTDAMPEVAAPQTSLMDAANTLELPAAGAQTSPVSAPTTLADLTAPPMPAAIPESVQPSFPVMPAAVPVVDPTFGGALTQTAPGQFENLANIQTPPPSATAPAAPAQQQQQDAGGTGMDFWEGMPDIEDPLDLSQWGSGEAGMASDDAGNTTYDQGVTYPNGAGGGGLGGLQDALKRLLAGGALAPELRKALGLPDPGAQQGASIYDMIGRVAPSLMGYLASQKQTAAYKDLADKYMGFGAPSRARFESSFAPGFTMANDPGYTDMLDQTAKATLHRLSPGGNPVGSPNAWAKTLEDLNAKVAYPALQDYRRTNAGSGGLAALTGAAPGAASGAIASQGNAYGAIGGGIADVFNPPKSLAQVLGDMKRAGAY